MSSSLIKSPKPGLFFQISALPLLSGLLRHHLLEIMRILTLGYRPHIFSFRFIDTVRICKSYRGEGNYGCMSCLMFNGRHTCKIMAVCLALCSTAGIPVKAKFRIVSPVTLKRCHWKRLYFQTTGVKYYRLIILHLILKTLTIVTINLQTTQPDFKGKMSLLICKFVSWCDVAD
jgi:hypothetical protein